MSKKSIPLQKKKLRANPLVDIHNISIFWHSSIFQDEMSFCDMQWYLFRTQCTNNKDVLTPRPK